ncbi:potassium transporter 5-like [Papaver somniferum]|uniref:potassium transporter 5-like n=1 Tax=Papaver somniferum TaxID=3469 RepID=UPI000E6FCA08|nr:potassium transporter 5-like [Papaver somniferum]
MQNRDTAYVRVEEVNSELKIGDLDQKSDEINNGDIEAPTTEKIEKGLKERKVSWGKLGRVDSLNLEAGKVSNDPGHKYKLDRKTTLSLAFQTVGVIYGDIGTSPLYVYSSTFTNGIKNKDDLLGVLSLIIYTLAISPMIKYVCIVLWANDHGNGGTFALYSLICRYAKVGLMPNQQPEDRELSHYKLGKPSNQLRRAQKIKHTLENSKVIQIILFCLTILGVSMVIGDGILTPSISVLSAVGGIKQRDNLNQDAVVWISVVILILLFSAQQFGTDKVGSTFAPIILVWFTFISGIALYNLIKHDVTVLRSFNPMYIIQYFQRNGKTAWLSLGGVVLCVTGTEAMFADLGHFSVRAIQVSFSGVVFPALLACYIGKAAYLSKFPNDVHDTFYKSIPSKTNIYIYWPTFVIAVAAAIIASQAMISAAFSIITQALSLGAFPRVKVVHTSAKFEGQVYIPELNYFIMIATVLITLVFRTTEQIGNAYGIAVVSVMVITTNLVTLIMLFIWKTSIWLVALFYIVLVSIEATYLSAVLYKFTKGGYLPVALALVLMAMMGTWHYVHKKRYMFELKNKVSGEFVRDLVKHRDVNRIPGISLLYSELVQGIPPIFRHFVENIPSIHLVLVFVSIKRIPVSKVAAEERFIFRQVEQKEYRMFRCLAHYGYDDIVGNSDDFEQDLVKNLKEFILYESYVLEYGSTEDTTNTNQLAEELASAPHSCQIAPSGTRSSNSSSGIQTLPLQAAAKEIEFIKKAMDKGVVYLLGETEVNYFYHFLRNNLMESDKLLSIPHHKLLRVGMTYEI